MHGAIHISSRPILWNPNLTRMRKAFEVQRFQWQVAILVILDFWHPNNVYKNQLPHNNNFECTKLVQDILCSVGVLHHILNFRKTSLPMQWILKKNSMLQYNIEKTNLRNNNYVLPIDDQKLKILNILPFLKMTWKNVICLLQVLWYGEYWDLGVKSIVHSNSCLDFIYMFSRERTINNLWGWPLKMVNR
jgi:hypothetical protein